MVCLPLIILVLLGPATSGSAQPLDVSPGEIRLTGSDSLVQVVVTGRTLHGEALDLTPTARYVVVDPSIARVDPGGLVRPLRDGRTRIGVEAGGASTNLTIEVSDMADKAPVRFVSQILPILTRYGCNAGGCHGKASGQNGFRLSLLGFDPRSDYETLVREARGRRVFPADPARSLFLLKPTATLPHGGGRKFSVDGPEYRIIARWIRQGMPYRPDTEPALVRLDVEPKHRSIPRGSKQQLRVVAEYANGVRNDVTRLAQFQSNATDVALVGDDGMVEAQKGVGEAAIMARFAGLVGV